MYSTNTTNKAGYSKRHSEQSIIPSTVMTRNKTLRCSKSHHHSCKCTNKRSKTIRSRLEISSFHRSERTSMMSSHRRNDTKVTRRRHQRHLNQKSVILTTYRKRKRVKTRPRTSLLNKKKRRKGRKSALLPQIYTIATYQLQTS